MPTRTRVAVALQGHLGVRWQAVPLRGDRCVGFGAGFGAGLPGQPYMSIICC